jgi:hypothetical protein
LDPDRARPSEKTYAALTPEEEITQRIIMTRGNLQRPRARNGCLLPLAVSGRRRISSHAKLRREATVREPGPDREALERSSSGCHC